MTRELHEITPNPTLIVNLSPAYLWKTDNTILTAQHCAGRRDWELRYQQQRFVLLPAIASFVYKSVDSEHYGKQSTGNR